VEDYCAKIETHLFDSNSTYLTSTFSAADICVSIWLALTMQKCKLTKLPQQVFRWAMTTLSAIKPYAKKAIGSLMNGLEEGAVSPESKPQTAAPKAAAAPVPKAAAAPAPKAAAPVPKAAATAPAPAAAAPAASGDLADNSMIKKLQEFGIEHEVYSHSACMTAEELVANVPLASAKETHTKNLLFRDKKHGMFLVTQATSSTFNTKQLGALLNLQGKVNLRLADAKLLDQHLKAQPGCVGPLCIVNDSSKEITLVLDKALMDFDLIHSHPLRNDASVKLTPAALKEYMSKAGVEPAVVDFATGGDAKAGAAGGDAGGKAPANRPPQAKQAPKPKKDDQEKKPQQHAKQQKKTGKKGDTLLALQWKKSENFPAWYSDVIVLSEMISYYDISGCYILRPWSYKVWDLIQQWFNKEVSGSPSFCV
jgi:hypothetical protein